MSNGGGGAGDCSNGVSRRGRKTTYDTKYTDAFNEYLSDHGDVAKAKPSAALIWLKEKFGPDLPDRFPTDQQAKSKFSRMKAELKRGSGS